jgi:hypothetical protein
MAPPWPTMPYASNHLRQSRTGVARVSQCSRRLLCTCRCRHGGRLLGTFDETDLADDLYSRPSAIQKALEPQLVTDDTLMWCVVVTSYHAVWPTR